MTIQQVFDYVDEIKPNAFSNETKMVWLNEVEGLVQTEIFLWNDSECFEYNYAYSGDASVYFPDEHTMAFTDTSLLKHFRPGGIIRDFDPASPYSGNAFTARTIQSITDFGLVFAESFADTGTEPITAAIDYYGGDVELLVSVPHSKIYGAYLIAKVDFANGEYDKYNNTVTMFNSYWGEFSRWFARVYGPAGRRP